MRTFILDAGGIHTEASADSPPAFSDKKDQITKSPAEVTDIGNLLHNSKSQA
jgi:hypothetical protein